MNKNISTEILINASKEKVWNILTDFGNYKYWNPFMINSSGQAVVGTKLVNTMKNKDKQMKFKPTILSVKQYEYFDWLGSLYFKGLFDGHHFFKLEDWGNGQMKLIQGEYFSGILSGMILKSIGEDTKNNFVKMNNALKEYAEKN
ncbi:MAG: SRPBCC domain-containing protein [Ginsengibacter sp.]